MHDEQDPPVTPGAQTDPSGDEAAAGAVAVSEFDVELPFDGSDAGSSVGALAPAGPADAVEAEAAAAEVPATGEAAVTDDEPAVAPAVEAPPAEAPAGGDAGISTDDPEEATRRKLALLAEAEAIVATPDVNEAGNAPDDRHLTERLRAVENVWRQVGSAGDREAELRARLQELRQAYAAARSRRAEARAVDRARAAETKR
ncbi:MAG TPA: hypothetical protein VHE83_05795, partial [Mycobacteriales bacterium]|nr:hypothetical protein [Mycobacteriales bacterium]